MVLPWGKVLSCSLVVVMSWLSVLGLKRSLRSADGQWKEFFITSPTGRRVQLYLPNDQSPKTRATIALDRCSRALAWLQGRDFVTPDDIRAVAHDVLRHRLILSFEAEASGVTANQVIDTLLESVASA